MEKKMTKKKKILISAVIILFALLLAFILYYVLKPDKGVEVDTVVVKRATVVQTLEKTGTVESEDEGKFSLADGITVDKVQVKVGQVVKKGDIMVTFKTNSLDAAVKEKYETYTTAKKAYDDYISSASSSSGQLSAVNSRISSLEKEIAKLEKTVETKKQESIKATEAQNKEIEELKEKLKKIIDDELAGSKLIEMIENNSESAQEFTDTLKLLLEKIGTTGNIDLSSAVSIVAANEEQEKLVEAQLELAELKAKQITLKLQSDNSLEKIYKKISDAAEKAYEKSKSNADKLKKGWIAQADGIVSEVNIKNGEKFSSGAKSSDEIDISSLISSVVSGDLDISSLVSSFTSSSKNVLTVKYYPLTASFTLNKSEISKVNIDKEVSVSSTGENSFSGKVIYKSAVASENSGINLSSIVGGSSSGSSGIEAKIQIDNPDSSVIIGMSVDITIETDRAENAIAVPIESIQYENSKAYVYIYNDGEKTVSKTEVEVGLRDDENYEIISGCSVGDILVKSPSTTLNDGDRVQIKATTK